MDRRAMLTAAAGGSGWLAFAASLWFGKKSGQAEDQQAPDARARDQKAPYDVTGLNVGDEHYRSYVGWPDKYDLIGATQFIVLVGLGLRQEHYLLDIGCGSLRAGRLFIPYLLPDRYCGIEPNRWLVEDGLKWEIGAELAALRRPRFEYNEQFDCRAFQSTFDFLIAHSIFTHASRSQIETCCRNVKACLAPQGVFVATYFLGESDYTGDKWAYPDAVKYRQRTLQELAQKAGLVSEPFNFFHASGQSWMLFGLREEVLAAAKKRLREILSV